MESAKLSLFKMAAVKNFTECLTAVGIVPKNNTFCKDNLKILW